MRAKRHLAGAVMLLSVIAPATCLGADGGLKDVFQARYATMKAVMAKRDASGITALLAPNFTSVDVSGQTSTGTQMSNEVAALPIDPNKTSETTILSVSADHDIATVNQRYDMKTAKPAADGATRNVELIALSTDTWIKSGGTWLLQRTVTKQADYFVNGQSVLHKTGNAP
ncbi:MAG TPA: nuclear transport factor 2 family protein [Rhizomicrobium sp.]|nr:nuclear transport factor 2 family protein [Rhizomicrobium sp.]